MANKVNVMIGGEVITLKSSEDEAYLQRIARYIDQKLADLMSVNVTASINEKVRTLLIAVNLADDYFKASDKLERLNTDHEKFITEIGRMQQENMMLKEKFHELQGDYARLQAEYEEFIAEFDAAKQNDSDNILSLPRPDQRKVVSR